MVTATGLGSGLDINTLVTAIVDAERTPLIARVDAKKADIDNLVSGYGSLQTAMAAVTGVGRAVIGPTTRPTAWVSTSRWRRRRAGSCPGGSADLPREAAWSMRSLDGSVAL